MANDPQPKIYKVDSKRTKRNQMISQVTSTTNPNELKSIFRPGSTLQSKTTRVGCCGRAK
ncbi:hypothetical protein [Ammoniphilus sp. 3BR4]|uniref:hypothetical protein n=1 Tax=Ammoniphilus sp. 3BR4 TaxID=3158265 RepID=UPI003466E0CF